MVTPLVKQTFLAVSLMAMALGMTTMSHRVTAAETTDADTLVASLDGQDFASKIVALMEAYPDGGDDFQAALVTLAAGEADSATAAAIMMVTLGDTATPGQIDAVIAAMKTLPAYTSEQIRAAIKAAVLNADDPVAAARGVLSAVPDLNAPDQLALGYGLGDAAVTLREKGDTSTAAIIVIEVTTSRMSVLVKSFEETTKTTVGKNIPGTNTGSTVNNQTGQTPENPGSPS